jgi:hypothetical protein
MVCAFYWCEKSSRKKAHQSPIPLIDSVKSKVERSSACCELVIGKPLLPLRSPDPPGLTWHHGSTTVMSCPATQQYAHWFPSDLNTILIAALPEMGACIQHPHAGQQLMYVTCTNMLRHFIYNIRVPLAAFEKKDHTLTHLFKNK